MKILALDTTSNIGSIALLEDENLIAEQSWENPSSHTSVLPVQLKKILEQTQSSLNEIDFYAVAKGPGSFTGIRIGLAFVKGLTLLNEKPVMGISTLEAMSLAYPTALTCPILDARREQIFAAAYDSQFSLQELFPEGAYNPLDFFKEIKALSEKKSILPLFIGSGSESYSEELHKVFGSKPFKIEVKMKIPLARIIALKAFKSKKEIPPFISSQELSPYYLRGAAVESSF